MIGAGRQGAGVAVDAAVYMGGGGLLGCLVRLAGGRAALMNETNACCWPFLPFFCNMAIFDAFSMPVLAPMHAGYSYDVSFSAKFDMVPF